DKGNPQAMMELGSIYVFSPEFSEKKDEGLRLLDEAVEKGYDGANDYLGLYYFQNKDYAKALKYFEARKGIHYGFAYAALGSMYLEGNGVAENGKEARENYRQAALKGYSRGMSLYANLLGTKNGGSLNYPDAFQWHYIAGDLGENYSRVMLYRPRIPEKQPNGEVAKDAQVALQWIEMVHSGKSIKNEPLYKDGFLPGLKECEKAAENGDDWSRFYLGSMNYNGDFLNQNYARAIHYFEPISKNGKLPQNLLSLVNKRLAEMYREGKGTAADQSKAAYYEHLAAQ
ncbi:MAG: sel1 repeat family protein, partial [Muribaculaceae bacterium]|nr:sel1 repeat family protein [Muribaculaceae bacterium]